MDDDEGDALSEGLVSLTVPTANLRTTRINALPDLAPFLDEWRVLAAGAPMRSPEWLLGWWEFFSRRDDELCILLFRAPQGTLVGLAPLYLQGGRGIFRLLGAGDACTHHLDWLCAAGWETRVGTGVAQFLLEFRSDWKRLLFEAVDVDATAIRVTMACLAESGCLWHQRQINSCWKIALPTSWDAYLQTLSRSLRKRCRKLQRQLLDTGKVKIHQVESEEDLQRGFEVLLALHAVRWGNVNKPLGVFNDQRFWTFHQAVARKMLAARNLRLAWLECEGKPIAVEYQFFDAQAVYAYQAGLDLAMDEYAPGKLSMMAAIQFALARGCKYFDLLGGDEPYKANWRAVPVPCHDHRIWQEGEGGWLGWVLWSGYTVAAARLKLIIPSSLIHLGLRFAQAVGTQFRRRRSS